MWLYNAARERMPRPNFRKETMYMARKKTLSEADKVAMSGAKGVLAILTVLIQIRDGAGTTLERAHSEALDVMYFVINPGQGKSKKSQN